MGQPINLSEGLVAHYEFEGSANDSSGNGNHGAEFGGVTYVDGVSGQAANFDGVDDYIRIPNQDYINFENNESFTINVWVMPDQQQADLRNADNDIVEKWSGWEHYPYVIRLLNRDYYAQSGAFLAKDTLQAAQYNFDTKENPYVGFGPISYDEYTLITLKKEAGNLYLYKNGSIVSEVSSDIGLTANQSDLFIAARGNMTNFFKGKVDDLRIYNRALTDVEVQALYDIRVQQVANTSVILKTGQTKSYDQSGNEVTDGSVKDDGYYQTGATRSYTRDDTEEIVSDNTTGLMWQDDYNAASVMKPWLTLANFFAGNASDTSGDTAATYCENLMLGSYTDWRLPTQEELLSITDLGHDNPAIGPVFQNVVSDNYWSSTSVEFNPGSAWSVYFDNGGDYWAGKDYSYYVRCVRGGQ